MLKQLPMKPLIYAALLIIVWPLSYPLARLGLHYFSPEGLLAWRLEAAALVMALYVLHQRFPLPARADLVRFFASGMLGVFGFIYFINLASKTLPAGEVSFLVSINPLYLVIRNAVTGHEKVTGRVLAGSLVSLAGLAMITLWSGALRVDIGMVYALVSGLSFACGMVVQKPLFTRYPMAMIGAWLPIMAAIGALPLWLLHFHEMPQQTAWQGIGVVLFTAFVGTNAAYLVWAYLNKALTQTQASSIIYFLPFSASLTAVPILGEQMAMTSWIGGAAIVLGSVITHAKLTRRVTSGPAQQS